MLEKKPKQTISDLSFNLHKKRTILALQHCYVHLILNIKAFSFFYVNDLEQGIEVARPPHSGRI